jgi:serine protease inhibitor
MLNLRVSASVIALVALAACGSNTEPNGPPAALTALPRELTAAERTISTTGNDFSLALFRQINRAQPQENVFVSPLSASMALGMTLNGAAGGTFDAMRGALSFGDASQQTINEGYKGLIALLGGLDKRTTFQLANSVWYRQGFSIEQSFLDATRTYFGADVKALDFASKQSSLATINGWVNDKTNGKIPTIIDDIPPQEVAFLINAIYFKGSWRDAFDPAETQDAPFHTLGGSTQTVRLMHRTGRDHKVRLYSTPDYQIADLPYGNDAWTMTVLLPNAGKDINAIIAGLTASEWTTLTGQLVDRDGVDVFLPKFKVTWERTLNDDLKALGMTVAFDPNAANFTKMSAAGGLYIDFVKQKTFVDVNEEGTEAAAATAVGIGLTSLPPTFRVDRPFVFVIRERFSGTILFMGKIGQIPAA